MPSPEIRSIRDKIKQGLHLEQSLRLVWRSAPGWTLANFGLILVQGLLPLASLYLMKLIVDGVTRGVTAPGKVQAFGQVLILIGLAALVALFGALCRFLSEIVKEAQTQEVTDYVADVIHAKSAAVDLEYYEDPKYHDTLHRAQQESSSRPTSIMNSLMQLGQSGISLLALAGLLVSFHWALAAVLFVAMVPGVWLRLKAADRMYEWQRSRTLSERQAWYFHWLLIGAEHAKEIRLFGLGSLFMGWFRQLRRQLRQERLKLITGRSLAELITQASANLAIFGTLAFITYRTIGGFITLGDMVMYYGAFQRAQGALQEMWSSLTSLYEDNLFLSNFNEFLELKPRLAEPKAPAAFPRPIREGIRFQEVSFHYPNEARLALDGVSLQIKPGQVVALVGENGSGKTTLIKLLCRLYDPVNGMISVDGTDLRQFSQAALRKEISVILQDYARYSLSARENIWLGDISVSSQDERLIEAARQTGADDFITRLPRGYDTILEHWFGDEGELSMGEWQRVALARAFFRQSQMIILDEPTSWMDARGEYEVFKSFRQLFAGRTTLLISHRFSTVRLADYIYVLADGKLIEQGSHEDLLRQRGKYANLFEIQAKSYR